MPISVPSFLLVRINSPHAYYLNPFLVGVAILVLLGLWESKRRSGWPLTVALFGPLFLALAAYYLLGYIGRLAELSSSPFQVSTYWRDMAPPGSSGWCPGRAFWPWSW